MRSLQGEALSVVALAEEFTSVDSFKVLPCVYLPDSGYEYYAVSVPILTVELDYEEQYDGPEFLDPLGNSAIVIVVLPLSPSISPKGLISQPLGN